MAVLAGQRAKIGGTALTFVAAAAGGDSVTPGNQSYLIVKNAAASPITVTVITPGNTKWGLPDPDIVSVSVPATTGEVIIGPIPAELANPSTGNVDVTYSAVTTVTVAHVLC